MEGRERIVIFGVSLNLKLFFKSCLVSLSPLRLRLAETMEVFKVGKAIQSLTECHQDEVSSQAHVCVCVGRGRDRGRAGLVHILVSTCLHIGRQQQRALYENTNICIWKYMHSSVHRQ